MTVISIRSTREDRERYVKNILDVYEDATEDQLRRGLHWYEFANQFARFLAEGEDPRQVAGVIAALSANKRWAVNKHLAEDAVNGNLHGTFGDAIRKAARILAGADPDDVLPTGFKTWNFFRAINDPSDPDVVVVDRHAHDIAVGEAYGIRDRGLDCAKRYALIAHVYREAAHRLGVLPSQVQAVTWVVWTERS